MSDTQVNSQAQEEQPIFHGFPNGIVPLGEQMQIAEPAQGEQGKAEAEAHRNRALESLQRILAVLDEELNTLTPAQGELHVNGVRSAIAFSKRQFGAKLSEISGNGVGG